MIWTVVESLQLDAWGMSAACRRTVSLRRVFRRTSVECRGDSRSPRGAVLASTYPPAAYGEGLIIRFLPDQLGGKRARRTRRGPAALSILRDKLPPPFKIGGFQLRELHLGKQASSRADRVSPAFGYLGGAADESMTRARPKSSSAEVGRPSDGSARAVAT